MTRRTKKSDFIGRRKTKPLKPRPAALVKNLLPELRLDTSQAAPDDLRQLFNEVEDVYLEIGFGGGKHLVHRAASDADTGFIGVEPFINGLSQALMLVDTAQITNVRFHDDDAGALLDWLPAASIERVFLLYPDPWPKFKHWKRRFVSPRNLDRIARVLKPGGLFLFASDIEHYVGWTLDHCHKHAAYSWTATGSDDWISTEGGAFSDWPGTRYEAKAQEAGRLPTYLTFQRI